jgi:putative spermidine/putrescine transport system substrate-binding protein
MGEQEVNKALTESVTRRQVMQRGLGVAAVASLPALLAACGGGSSGAASTGAVSSAGSKLSGSITFTSFGGPYQDAIQRAWLDPFQAANPGVKIIQDQPTDYAKLEAMVKANAVVWDVVDVDSQYGLKSATPFLTPIDCKVVDCSALPQAGLLRVPTAQSTALMAYRTDKIKNPPQTWADYFDLDKFPGKRSFWRHPGLSNELEFALLADGVAVKDLYPLDVERALKKLDTIRDQIIWYTDIQAGAQLLADGEVLIGRTFGTRVLSLKKDGVPVEAIWNQGATGSNYLTVPKGTKNEAAAMALVAWITSNEHNADLTKYWPAAPANPTAAKTITKSNPFYPYLASTHADVTFNMNDQYYDTNLKKLDARINQWFEGS